MICSQVRHFIRLPHCFLCLFLEVTSLPAAMLAMTESTLPGNPPSTIPAIIQRGCASRPMTNDKLTINPVTIPRKDRKRPNRNRRSHRPTFFIVMPHRFVLVVVVIVRASMLRVRQCTAPLDLDSWRTNTHSSNSIANTAVICSPLVIVRDLINRSQSANSFLISDSVFIMHLEPHCLSI